MNWQYELKEFLDKAKHGICPRCHRELKAEQQVGRSVKAWPCRCRLWQGKARTREEIEADKREARGEKLGVDKAG